MVKDRLAQGGTALETRIPEPQAAAGETALPVESCKSELLELIQHNQVVIVCGETGSGKSTKIPQFLLEAGLVSADRKLAVTQPRKLAATALATRIAAEQGCEVGTAVGYSVRFDDRTSKSTAVKFLTDGMLLREMLNDPGLSNYGIVMLDETHERTINTDVILGLVHDLCSARPDPDFKVIISSATLDSQKFSGFFTPKAPVYNIAGRMFNVQCMYSKTHVDGMLDAVVSTVYQIHTETPLDGDILVFLAGQDDILRCEERLLKLKTEMKAEMPELLVTCVYSSMPDEQQSHIFNATPANSRKVVLATNIAETSVTIPQIRYVVDSGLEKQQAYNSRSGIDTLTVVHCSKASAKQRMGRAGRTSEGMCYRLYTQLEFDTVFPDQTEPELLRSNLSSVSLLLLSLGVNNILEFNWLDKPDTESTVGAIQTLYALGAVNANAKLTKLGRLLAEFPLDPKLAKSIVMARGFEEDMCIVAAMLGELGNIFIRPKYQIAADNAEAIHSRWKHASGDHLTLLNVFRAAQENNYSRWWCKQHFIQFRALQRARKVASQLNHQLKQTLQRANYYPQPSCSTIIEALAAGYFMQTARASKNRQDYVAIRLKDTVYVHPGSVLFGEKPPADMLIYHELVLTSKEYMRGCLKVETEVLEKIAPFFYHQCVRN